MRASTKKWFSRAKKLLQKTTVQKELYMVLFRRPHKLLAALKEINRRRGA